MLFLISMLVVVLCDKLDPTSTTVDGMLVLAAVEIVGELFMIYHVL